MTEDRIPNIHLRSFEEHEQLAMDALRDHFASAALTGLLANDEGAHELRSHKKVASEAYRYADEMLKARKKKP